MSFSIDRYRPEADTRLSDEGLSRNSKVAAACNRATPLTKDIFLNLSPKNKNYLATALLIVALFTFGFLAIQINNPIWAAGILVSIAVYAIWNIIFSCPACGTPYLYEFKGVFVVPSRFPRECKKCGHSTGP
jgi:hypothetical protein